MPKSTSLQAKEKNIQLKDQPGKSCSKVGQWTPTVLFPSSDGALHHPPPEAPVWLNLEEASYLQCRMKAQLGSVPCHPFWEAQPFVVTCLRQPTGREGTQKTI